jgi:hypothetical protein
MSLTRVLHGSARTRSKETARTFALFVLLVVWPFSAGCDECELGAWRCHNNQMQECYCDETPCVWDRGYPPCEDGTTCIVEQRAEEDEVACVTSMPCPDGEPKSHCRDEHTAVSCLGGFYNHAVHCPDDLPCTEFSDGAYCGARPGDCIEGGVACQQDGTYIVCEQGDPMSYNCPEGSSCDPSVESGNPCGPSVDAMTSAPDGG